MIYCIQDSEELKMQKFNFSYPWLKKILPEGLVMPSGTVITGPGGSGKPLVGTAFASSWLRQGGNVVMILTNTEKKDAARMFRLYDLNTDEYQGRLVFVELDLNVRGVETINADRLAVNLVIPENWDLMREVALSRFSNQDSEILFLGSALNLLLFSEFYRDAIIRKVIAFLQETSSIFAVSNSVLVNAVKNLEESADNLMVARTDEEMQLYLQVLRAKAVRFDSSETAIPLPKPVLRRMRDTVEKDRNNLIRKVRKMPVLSS